ncbi:MULTISPECIES: trimeric intracellular cation channel family protein [unclassified Luteimonas]|uniref:trimeric intracellular cation channel family protein n=1 Tax=unclassified Luteimonas TaxID=2629088 RepID=UPI0018F0CEC1|nr:MULTISPECIES: trimeric intracellular cation channel family protein [unclassified Luteimonas]MBJ6977867.1 trimeric intracellular cation channel family protein [Luteimonas sp. MC1895]MBJ6984687.1 trimeric intracellular cation channel family protein [Luteimonas sp. MC1750]QQO04716.1 trimeric intracellular cation channel family protein [Luteimonas sp. MC1750]
MLPPDFQGSLEFHRTLVLVLDLFGTFAFAVSGATAAVRRRLDLFGVLVVSFAASTFGGISRDVLIGDTPPAAFEDWRYLAVALAAGVVAFYWSALIERLRNPVRLLDAIGLAFFAVAGTQKALAFGLSPVMAALMGMLTGIGGGMARDILLADVPAVLRSELYAVAALAGAGIVVAGHLLGLPVLASALVAGLTCFGLRMAALRWGWRLPVARSPQSSSDDGPK